MRFLSFLLSSALLLAGIVYTAPAERAYAQSAGYSGASVGSAIANSVYTWATSNGFSVSDPRIADTLSAIGAAASSIGTQAASAMGTALGSVPWVAVAAYAGIGAILGAVPVSLGNSDDLLWKFNPDGTITLTRGDGTSTTVSPYAPLVSGTAPAPSGTAPSVYEGSCGDGGGVVYSSSAAGIAETCAQLAGTNAYGQFDYVGTCVQTGGVQSCNLMSNAYNPPQVVSTIVGSPITSEYDGPSCDSGMSTGGSCVAYAPPSSSSTPPPPPGPVSPATAVNSLSSADQAEDLSAQVLAATTNALWQAAAAEPDYSGLPYPVSAPVTSSMATTAETDMGSSVPTVGSYTGTAAGTVSGTGSLTVSVPTTGTSASTGASEATATNPGSGAQVNLGPDPGIGSPDLEAPPTAAQILAPILSLFPDLRSYVVPAHTSQCPEPSFDLWGQTYTFTAQCDLLNQYGSAITAAFTVAFTVAALFIVLSA